MLTPSTLKGIPCGSTACATGGGRASLTSRPCSGSMLAHRYRRPAVAVLITMSALIIGMARVDTASATISCSPYGGNYYGEACLFGSKVGSNFYGVSETVQSAALSVSDPASYFVDSDMWIVRSMPNPVFIEAGLFEGNWAGGSGERTVPTFVWGEDTPVSGLLAIIGGQPRLTPRTTTEIAYAGFDEWSINVGSLVGTALTNRWSPISFERGRGTK